MPTKVTKTNANFAARKNAREITNINKPSVGVELNETCMPQWAACIGHRRDTNRFVKAQISTLKPLSRTISVVKPELVGEVSAAKSHQLAFSWWETYHKQIIPEFMLTFGLTPLFFACWI